MKFFNYDLEPSSLTFTNDGRIPALTVNAASGAIPSFAYLNSTSKNATIYNLEAIHFHGMSEHQIDGQHAPLEIQFIHYDRARGNSVQEALAISIEDLGLDDILGSVAILSVMATVGKFDNPAYGKLLRFLPFLKSFNSTREVTNTPSMSSLLPDNTFKFYSYLGSMTSPIYTSEFAEYSELAGQEVAFGCFPQVQWYIFEVMNIKDLLIRTSIKSFILLFRTLLNLLLAKWTRSWTC